jgi:hypothetical protein
MGDLPASANPYLPSQWQPELATETSYLVLMAAWVDTQLRSKAQLFSPLHLLPADKKAAAQHALRFWFNRSLASAWGSWRLLVEIAHENEQKAYQHRNRVYAYMLTVGDCILQLHALACDD